MSSSVTAPFVLALLVGGAAGMRTHFESGQKEGGTCLAQQGATLPMGGRYMEIDFAEIKEGETLSVECPGNWAGTCNMDCICKEDKRGKNKCELNFGKTKDADGKTKGCNCRWQVRNCPATTMNQWVGLVEEGDNSKNVDFALAETQERQRVTMQCSEGLGDSAKFLDGTCEFECNNVGTSAEWKVYEVGGTTSGGFSSCFCNVKENVCPQQEWPMKFTKDGPDVMMRLPQAFPPAKHTVQCKDGNDNFKGSCSFECKDGQWGRAVDPKCWCQQEAKELDEKVVELETEAKDATGTCKAKSHKISARSPWAPFNLPERKQGEKFDAECEGGLEGKCLFACGATGWDYDYDPQDAKKRPTACRCSAKKDKTKCVANHRMGMNFENPPGSGKMERVDFALDELAAGKSVTLLCAEGWEGKCEWTCAAGDWKMVEEKCWCEKPGERPVKCKGYKSKSFEIFDKKGNRGYTGFLDVPYSKPGDVIESKEKSCPSKDFWGAFKGPGQMSSSKRCFIKCGEDGNWAIVPEKCCER